LAASDTRDEVALARDLIAGEPGAFDRFVEVFRSKIFHYAQMVCGQREDAEEVAQDTLFKVFSNFGQLREPERVKAWVFRIARNECLMRKRKSVFAPTQELSLDDFLPHQDQDDGRRLEIADWSALPDDQALRGELRSVVYAAIEKLPEIYRAVMTLRDIEELSTEETADALDISVEAVKTRLHRARLAVRQKLEEYMKGAKAGGMR
jgi:RNA polymerase sigma-70 factor (ECF subfamily)